MNQSAANNGKQDGKANPRRFRPETAPENSASPSPKKAEADVTAQGGLSKVVTRNEYYRDGYRNLLRVAVIEAFAIIALICAMVWVVSNSKPEYRYFATTEDGRLVPMIPLNQPNLSTPALMSWVAQAATEVMTFGFNDYKRRLQEASRNFTQPGWRSFSTALDNSKIIESVTSQQQVVTAAPRGAPIITYEGEVEGRYQWLIEVPLVVTFQSGSQRRSVNYSVQVVVVRLSRLENPNGIGIEQWVAKSG